MTAINVGQCGAHDIAKELERGVDDTFFRHEGKRVGGRTVKIGHDVKTKHVVLSLKACVGDAACGMFHKSKTGNELGVVASWLEGDQPRVFAHLTDGVAVIDSVASMERGEHMAMKHRNAVDIGHGIASKY